MGAAIEGNPFTASLYQVSHGLVCTHIIVDHYAAGIYARTYSIIEHDRNASINEFLVVVIVGRILRL